MIGHPVSIRLRRLLSWLLGNRDAIAMSLFWCIIFNLGWAIEHAFEIQDASDNPLDAPVLVGPRGRARKISAGQKHKIASLASAGKVYHSGAAVIRGMELLGKKFKVCAATGNKWSEPLAFRYLRQLQTTFSIERCCVLIYSVAWDATCLSHMDMLATTIYNPGENIAGWCPPQVLLV